MLLIIAVIHKPKRHFNSLLLTLGKSLKTAQEKYSLSKLKAIIFYLRMTDSHRLAILAIKG